MYLLLKKIFFTGLLSFCFVCALAQTKFTATISPAQINKDEYATLRLVVENANNIESISPPSLQNFIVVSGPNQESGMSSVNGAVTQYVAVSYILQPRKPGLINVGAGTATIGGKNVKSNTLKLTVNNATGGGNRNNAATNPLAFSDPFDDNRPSAPDFKDYILHKGENVPEKVSKNMQLRLQTDKTTCYVGEPLVATYKLYTRLKSESKLSKNPSFNGFSVIDLSSPDISDYKRETLNGREYNVYTIRKAQLYPLQAGEVDLETAVLDNDIQFLKDDGTNGPSSVNDLVNGFSVDPNEVITQSVSLTSKPVTITVKPLPEAGKPASFKGAVGIFNIESALQKPTFSTDETGTLAVRISGNGNLQLLNAPDINWPDGIDVFEPKVTDNTNTKTVPVSGNKVYIYSFAAQKEGSYTIPALTFSYFDPSKEAYKTITTAPITFTVTKGTGKPAYNISAASKKDEPSFLSNIFYHRWWIVVFIALIIFTALFFWLKKENKKEAVFQEQKKHALEEQEKNNAIMESAIVKQKNPLEETEACLYGEDCVEFYTILNKELKSFLATRYSLDAQAIHSKSLANALDKAGVENDCVLKLQQLMQEVEWQIYTPFVQTDNRQAMYSRALECVQELS